MPADDVRREIPFDTHTYQSDVALTFHEAERAFSQKELPFDGAVRQECGVQHPDGAFTNLGLLLSDQSPYPVRLAAFDDERGIAAPQQRELRGSVFAQIREASDWLAEHNRTLTRFSGPRKVRLSDYPERALREALVNCLVHRTYRCLDPIVIKAYPDRIEFASPGGAPHVEGDSPTAEDVEQGICLERNPALATVLRQLGLMRGCGSGLQLISELYEDVNYEPSVYSSNAVFRITLPNINYGYPTERRPSLGAVTATMPPRLSTTDVVIGTDDREQAVLDLARAQGRLSRADVESFLHTGRDIALTVLGRLVKQGLLVRTGSTRATKYELPGTIVSTPDTSDRRYPTMRLAANRPMYEPPIRDGRALFPSDWDDPEDSVYDALDR